MEPTSIWDIYESAKKLLPLYERMQNRSIRQESQSIQCHVNKSSDTIFSSLNDFILDDHNINSINNEDIVSVDLLTPLSSSPTMMSVSNKYANKSSNNNSSSTNKPATTGNIITPTSITESPKQTNSTGSNNTNNNSNSNIKLSSNLNNNNDEKLFDNFKNYSFADILDFNNDDDLISNDNEFDILRELEKINDNTINPLQILKPLDIKIKSECSVSLNNQNILSMANNNNNDDGDHENSNSTNNDLSIPTSKLNKQKEMENKSLNQSSAANDLSLKSNTKQVPIETTFINTSKATMTSTSSTQSSSSNPSKQKVAKAPSSPTNRPVVSSIPKPNDIQTQARQSKSSAISSSAPTKENIKPISKCSNCGTTKTPLWRKDPSGNTLCNACGLFLKLHGTMRPLSLKTDVIKKRNSKRQSITAQGEGYKNLSHISQNQKLSTSNNSTIFFPQSVPNSNINTCQSVPNQIQIIQHQPMLSKSHSKKLIPIHTQSQIPVTTNSNNNNSNKNYNNSRSKNVPILPKPSKDSSSPNSTSSIPNTPNSSNFSIGSSQSQPQDIPQFKRRKSKLNLSTSQMSQPSSPLTTINTGAMSSYSPTATSITGGYSPITHTNSHNLPGSPASSIPIYPKSVSRHNSISSNSSHQLYQELNNKRGLSYSNNAIGGNNNFGNFQFNSITSSTSIPLPTASVNVNNNNNLIQANNSLQKPSNFSNLSAGINAIRMTSNGKSGLSKCVANMNEAGRRPSKTSKMNSPMTTTFDAHMNKTNSSRNNSIPIRHGSLSTSVKPTNNNESTTQQGIDMNDLDWLKFDI